MKITSFLGLGLVFLLLPVVQERIAVEVQMKATVERVNDNASINWSEGYLEATGEAAYPSDKPIGQARLLARRGAIVDAQRNLLEAIEGVRVSAETVMRDMIVVSDEVRTRVEGIVRGAAVVDEQDKGSTYKVTLRMPLGRTAALINQVAQSPTQYRFTEQKVEQLIPETLPKNRVFVPQQTPQVSPPVPVPTESGPYTGLVIDCRELGIQPSMSPKIRRPDGTEVWGTVQVSPEVAVEYGIAAYAQDPAMLKYPAIEKRVGNRPLVVRAIGAAGSVVAKTDPVVSQEDAERILRENQRSRFLDRLNVVILH